MSERPTSDDDLLIQATLAANIEAEVRSLAAEIAGQLGDLEIPRHRLSGIVNSLAWHQRRATPQLRTQALGEEIQRLRQRAAPGSAEAGFYDFLLQRLELPRAASLRDEPLLRGAHIPADQRERWSAIARLSRARAAVQILETLLRSAGLRREIAQEGGSIQWQ